MYFPSFNLELAVICALDGYGNANVYLENRIQAVFDYLRDAFPTARFVDPANTSNIVSDDLTISEKQTISVAAKTARAAFYWTEIVQ